MEKCCGNCAKFLYEDYDGFGICCNGEPPHHKMACDLTCPAWHEREETGSRLIPKPIKYERHAVGDYKCPSCLVGYYGIERNEKGKLTGTTPYCGNCGQSLDWSGGDRTIIEEAEHE